MEEVGKAKIKVGERGRSEGDWINRRSGKGKGDKEGRRREKRRG